MRVFQDPPGLVVGLGQQGKQDEIRSQQVLAHAGQFGHRHLQDLHHLFGAQLGVVLDHFPFLLVSRCLL
jgi:hypothetical protein